MEIHRPKLVHSWRELAIEMGIIICGILIALSLEQTAEWLHKRAEVAEAREALRSEIAENARLALITVEEERCWAAYFDRIVQWTQGGPRPPRAPVIGFATPVFSVWETVKSSSATDMPLQERMSYARIYSSFQVDYSNLQQQLSGLNTLAGDLLYYSAPGAPSPSASDPAVRRALGTVDGVRRLMALRARQAQQNADAAKSIGVAPRPTAAYERDQLQKFCAMTGVQPRLQ